MSPFGKHFVVFTYTLANGAVLVAPAVVLAVGTARAEVPLSHGVDLVMGSAALAVVHGVIVWRWLASATLGGARSRAVSAGISSLNGLVVLALTATGLLTAVLVGFAEVHVLLAVAGWPVVALWVGVEAAAVLLAEVVRRRVFTWLEPAHDDSLGTSLGGAAR